jgi:hypothetical protein
VYSFAGIAEATLIDIAGREEKVKKHQLASELMLLA